MMLGGIPIPAPPGGCTYLGSLVGKVPVFEESDQALRGNPLDVTKLHELIGGTTVDWRDGMRRMAARFHPDLVTSR
jgi:UDP-glucuronate 4-epimerase